MTKELKEIKKVYYKLNEDIISNMPLNIEETRVETIHKILQELEPVLNALVIRVICDESNNTPEVIDNNQMIARVEWRMTKYDKVHYVDLTFGDVNLIWK